MMQRKTSKIRIKANDCVYDFSLKLSKYDQINWNLSSWVKASLKSILLDSLCLNPDKKTFRHNDLKHKWMIPIRKFQDQKVIH